MDNKSIEILKSLKGHLEKGSMKIETFPQSDVMDMVRAEYTGWMTIILRQMEEYFRLYEILTKHYIDEKNSSEFLKLLDNLILDSQKTPIEALDRIDALRKIEDGIIIESFMENARAAYERYPFQSTLGEMAFQGKGVVYTVITGDYDVLREPEYVDDAFDYICFTNNRKLHSEVWDIRYLENPEELDDARLSRKPKILCHEFLPEYDYSVYVDGKLQIVGDLMEYIKKYSLGSPMLCFPHYVRRCAYEEAEACIEAGKDNYAIIRSQMNEYRQEGYPANNGLIDAACMVRKHGDKILQNVMECWWKEVREKSRRDQLSIGYACWKNDFHYDLCDLFSCKNNYICKRRDRERAF